jgi:hypothetical protein
MNANDPRRVAKELRSWTNGRHMPKETPLHRVMSAAATLLETMPTREQVEDCLNEARRYFGTNIMRNAKFAKRVHANIAALYAPPSQPEPAAAPTGDGDVVDWPTEPGEWERDGERYIAWHIACGTVKQIGVWFDRHKGWLVHHQGYDGGWRRVPSPEADLRAHIDRLSQRCGFPIVVNLPQVLETIGNKVERLERERDALAEKLKACEANWREARQRIDECLAAKRGELSHREARALHAVADHMDSLIAPADAAVEDKPGPPMEPTDVRHAFEQLYECWNYGELDDAEFMAKFADLAKEQR